MLVWINGEMKDEKEVEIHPLSHSLHYGDAAFEGIRAYEQKDGSVAIFRLKEHAERMVRSSEILMGTNVPFTAKDVEEACKAVIRENNHKDAYIRPIFFLGNGTIGLNNIEKNKQYLAVMALPFPSYLGDKPIRVMISSYRKTPSVVQPSTAKLSANYVNSIFATREAKRAGYDEALLLNIHERVAEGPGENFFLVKKGKIYTPPVSEDILEGITRDTVITIARELGYEVIERTLGVSDIYGAEEAFFTGTAAEVTPIAEVSSFKFGDGSTGPITEKIRSSFKEAVRGNTEHKEWLSKV
ncbi:MAG: branched-chain amino acid transaminase [Methanobacteriota archaeon]|nr:MAG: branched-chain amino acid transaminase [Euryarchaeota archaeon]